LTTGLLVSALTTGLLVSALTTGLLVSALTTGLLVAALTMSHARSPLPLLMGVHGLLLGVLTKVGVSGTLKLVSGVAPPPTASEAIMESGAVTVAGTGVSSPDGVDDDIADVGDVAIGLGVIIIGVGDVVIGVGDVIIAAVAGPPTPTLGEAGDGTPCADPSTVRPVGDAAAA
jgi:hypothetical protein